MNNFKFDLLLLIGKELQLVEDQAEQGRDYNPDE
jgi:hypothetical protein